MGGREAPAALRGRAHELHRGAGGRAVHHRHRARHGADAEGGPSTRAGHYGVAEAGGGGGGCVREEGLRRMDGATAEQRAMQIGSSNAPRILQNGITWMSYSHT